MDRKDAMNSKERFLAACRRQPVDRPPVWIMRQAGRYLPEFRELRAKHSFLEVCRTPELAREVALQPLRRFPLDASILFSDILVVPEAMGLELAFPPQGGPTLNPPIRSAEDVARLIEPDIVESLGYVGDAVEAIREGIGPERALIGFAGAPYTLATYMIEGGSSKQFKQLKRLAYTQPETYHQLMDRMTNVLVGYLRMQAERGADALQLFDSWAGDLSPHDFRALALPWVKRIIEGLSDLDVPLIYFINGVAGLLDQALESGAQVLGIDWRMSMLQARERTGGKVALQGNLDPLELYGPEERIRARTREIHAEMGGEPGHIFNLGHGILPDAPIEGLAAFVDEVTKLG